MIAASGEATLLLADLGLLNRIHHTSINGNYLRTFSFAYNGHDNYINDASVCHHGIITAGGLDPVDFSETVLSVLDVSAQVQRSQWEEIMF
jgi:hypothetical protein